MPHINIQYQGKIQNPDGTTQDVPGGIGLQAEGPRVQVTIHVSQPIANALQSSGKQLPKPQVGMGMIDTGASVTCVDLGAAKAMGLSEIDTVQMASASHSSHPAPIYPVRLTIQGNMNVDVPKAMGASLQPQGLIALIGRDVLVHCTLYYNGYSGAVTLSV